MIFEILAWLCTIWNEAYCNNTESTVNVITVTVPPVIMVMACRGVGRCELVTADTHCMGNIYNQFLNNSNLLI